MNIDIKSILLDALTKMFESNLWLIVIIFVVAIATYLFRHDIAYDFDLTRREKNKLTEKSLYFAVIIGTISIFYLYAKEYYFLLSISISFILTYFLHQIGFLDMVVEKLEDKYGR